MIITTINLEFRHIKWLVFHDIFEPQNTKLLIYLKIYHPYDFYAKNRFACKI